MFASPLRVLDTGLTGAGNTVRNTPSLLTRVCQLTQVRLVATRVIIVGPHQRLSTGSSIGDILKILMLILSPGWPLLRLQVWALGCVVGLVSGGAQPGVPPALHHLRVLSPHLTNNHLNMRRSAFKVTTWQLLLLCCMWSCASPDQEKDWASLIIKCVRIASWWEWSL